MNVGWKAHSLSGRLAGTAGVLLALAGTGVVAAPQNVVLASPPPRANCAIIIDTVKLDGQRLRLTFKTRLHNARECRQLAQIHDKNFEPQVVAHKKVAFRWLGGGIAARAARRHHRATHSNLSGRRAR